MFQLVALGCLILLCFRVTADSTQPQLPRDVEINKDAGRGNFLFVTLHLKDSSGLPFVVDTGSSITIFAKSLEPKLGKRLGTDECHFPDNKHSNRYAAPKLYLEGTPLMTDSTINTLDLKRLSKELPKDVRRPIMGIIGIGCLSNYCIQLDFNAGKMRFLDSNHLDIKNLGKAFPMTIASPDNRPFIRHPGLAGGTSTNCLIDTGCCYDGWVEKGTIEGHHLTESKWDGQTYTNLNLAVGDQANVLGLSFLARHLVTLNFPRQTMYLRQTSIGPLSSHENTTRN